MGISEYEWKTREWDINQNHTIAKIVFPFDGNLRMIFRSFLIYIRRKNIKYKWHKFHTLRRNPFQQKLYRLESCSRF